MVRCVVNSNAVPAPTITWYMGSTDITNMAGSNASSIIITVNREHNNKTLECKATNNNKPSKTGATTLKVECRFLLSKWEKKEPFNNEFKHILYTPLWINTQIWDLLLPEMNKYIFLHDVIFPNTNNFVIYVIYIICPDKPD